MHDIVGCLIKCTCRTWSSYMHMTVIRIWLNSKPQNITKKYAHVHRKCGSSVAIIYTRWMQGLGGRAWASWMCVYIPRRSDRTRLSVGCYDASRLALSHSLLCWSLSSLLWEDLTVLLESYITVEKSSRHDLTLITKVDRTFNIWVKASH